MKPTCPDGQTYCVDGQCHSGSCPSDLLSFCACYGAPAFQADVFPCNQDQVVTIPNFNAANKTAQSLAACQANATITVSDWSESATGPIWNTCPVATTPAGPPNYTSPFFMAMWVFFASLLVLNVLWYLYKIAREKVSLVNIMDMTKPCCMGAMALVMSLFQAFQGFNRLIWRGDKFLLCRIPYMERVYCMGCTLLKFYGFLFSIHHLGY